MSDAEDETFDDVECWSDGDTSLFARDDVSTSASPAASQMTSGESPVQPSIRPSYDNLSREELEEYHSSILKEVTDVLLVEPHTAQLFLSCYGWNPSLVNQAWYDDKSTVFNRINMNSWITTINSESIERLKESENESFYCNMMMDDYPLQDTDTLACGHRFSKEFWQGHLKVILEGGRVLRQTCVGLDNKCPQIIDRDMWIRTVDDICFSKYKSLLVEQLVETHPSLRWCPGADCGYSMRILQNFVEGEEVECSSCRQLLCFSCGEEGHSPISCEIARKWSVKHGEESKNRKWFILYTKNCPECQAPINKNGGCQVMHCKCGAEFCWICLELTTNHQHASIYSCNRYNLDSTRYDSTQDFKRFTHYSQRYDFHSSARNVIIKRLQTVRSEIESIRLETGEVLSIDFIESAVRELCRCRRMMSCSYAWGFFATNIQPQRKDLFENYQSLLEHHLDTLHQELIRFFNSVPQTQKFFNFSPEKILNLTTVVGGFFDPMRRALKETFQTEAEEENSQTPQNLPTPQ